MPDTPTQQSTGPSQYTGQVSLKDDGQILTTDEPSVQTSSLPDSTAAATPNATQGPQNPNATTTQPGPTQQPAQNQQQTNPAQKTPDLSKTPGGNNTPAATAPTGKSQSEQRASKLYTAAESLAGGARYKYTVDANGNMQKIKVPVSLPHLGMALALEALSGAAAGLGVANGPGNLGRAAAAGFNQEAQRRQQEDQQAQKQATDDYARRAQVFETNMRTYANARAVGALDEKATDDTINNTKPHIDWIKENFPSSFEGIASYDDLSKYNATLQNALPYQKVPRMKDGKQVSIDGVPKWDMLYWIYDPSKVKGAGGINPHMQENLSRYGYAWAANPQIMNSPFSGEQVGNIGAISAGIDAFEATGKNIEKRINSVGEKSPNAGLTIPGIKDENLAKIADTAAAQFPSVPKALQRAVILNESSGNINNPDSPTGAGGVMQLIPSTAKAMGVQDVHNPTQNVIGGTKYLSTLLDPKQYPQINGDPILAAAAYASGPGAVKDGKIVDVTINTAKGPLTIPASTTQNYVDKIIKMTGLGSSSATSSTDDDTKKFKLPDAAEFSKSHGTWAQDVTKFIPAFTSAKENLALTLDHLRNSGDKSAADHLQEYFGGPDNITNHDIAVETQAEQRKEDIKTQATEAKGAFKTQQDQAASDRMEAYLKVPDEFSLDPTIMEKSMPEAEAALKASGAQVPPHFAALYNMAKGKISPNTFFPKVWTKGSPYEMDAQTAKSYIETFLNPDYNDATYPAAAKMRTEIASGNSKIGQAIIGAGTAAQHLEMLKQGAQALKNNDLQTLNRIANSLGVATGQPAPVLFKALGDKVTQEVERVAAGGTTPYKDAIEAGQKSLSSDNSPEQIEGVIRAYTGLMFGRLNSIDEDAHNITKDHLPNVSPEATALFQRYGYNPPWSAQQGTQTSNTQKPQNNKQQQLLPGQRPNEVPVKDAKGQLIGFSLPGKQGYRPIQSAQQ